MATLAEKLAQAKATYNKNVSNQESSAIINRSKAAVDAAQKAYDASGSRGATAPIDAAKAYALSPAGMRAELDKLNAAAAAKKARIDSDPDVIAARKLQAEAAAEVAATAKSKDEALRATGKTAAEYAAGKAAAKAAADKVAADKKAAADAKAAASKAAAAAAAAIAKEKADAKIKADAIAAEKAAAAKTAAAAAATKAELAKKAEAIRVANAAAAQAANETANALKAVAENAATAATAAILAAQVSQTAEATALVAKLQEEARIAAAAAATAAAAAAAKDAQIASTATQLAAAQRAIDAANAATAAATAASATSTAAAAANINQSGDVAIDTASISDTASAMYAQELKDKAEKEKVLLERQSVSEIMTARFKEYKLESLVDTIKNLAIEGASEATITLALQDTRAYKERFKANEARVKANLRVLSPSEYLKNEDAYRQTLREYGLNKYDTDDYVTKFIENDTAPEELSGRIALGVNRIQNADPLVVKTLKAYGVTDTDMLEYVLDTKNKLPEITRKVQIAEVGAAARAQGLNAGTTEEQIAGYKATSEALVNQGVDQAAAQKGYSAIASYLPEAEKLSGIYSNMEGYGQTQAEQEVFGKMASAQRAREALRMREIGTFSGSAGTTKGSLASSTKGQLY